MNSRERLRIWRLSFTGSIPLWVFLFPLYYFVREITILWLIFPIIPMFWIFSLLRMIHWWKIIRKEKKLIKPLESTKTT